MVVVATQQLEMKCPEWQSKAMSSDKRLFENLNVRHCLLPFTPPFFEAEPFNKCFQRGLED
jgi:hypothetical protein